MIAQTTIYAGFRLILRDGMGINTRKDSWLKGKGYYRFNRDYDYGTEEILVSNFFMDDNESWDVQFFSKEDARLILATRVPQMNATDRVAWTKTTNVFIVLKLGTNCGMIKMWEMPISYRRVDGKNYGDLIFHIK